MLSNKTFVLVLCVLFAFSALVSCEDNHRACDTHLNCTNSPYQFCMNGICKCQPNYALSNGQCVKTSCYKNPTICEDVDKNRFCEQYASLSYGHCICKTGYVEDPKTKACRKICSETSEDKCKIMDGPNTVCNIYRCQCRANHRRDSETGECLPFRCETDSQCWSEGDHYRSCLNNTCACPYEEDPVTQRCYIRITSILNLRYYQSWKSERILLATIIIVPIIFYYCLCQNYRKARSTIVYLKNPSPGKTFYSHQATLTKSQLNGECNEKCTIQFSKDNERIKYERFE